MADAQSQGGYSGGHRLTLLRAQTRLTTDGKKKQVCKYGVKCYMRNPKHLEEFSHPADESYLVCCKEEGLKPDFVSVRKLFEWCDSTDSGKADRAEIENIWPDITALGQSVPAMTDALWSQLDDDGNGHINFSEFAEMTTKFNVGLPLGLDHLFESNHGADDMLECGVMNCPCKHFQGQRRRCKYGEKCFQKKEEHLQSFAHPGDHDWESAHSSRGDKEMCTCGHKKKLHASSCSGVETVPYPSYWDAKVIGGQEFNSQPPVSPEIAKHLQILMDKTYSDVTTRDRVRSSALASGGSGSWEVPRGFKLVGATRNENSKLWRKYAIKKADLKKEKQVLDDPYAVFNDVLTSQVWESFDCDRLDSDINEWYLFHGTSASAARNICSTDFKMRLAGSATGTLYGKGSYLGESITKADEYAKCESGIYTVLLCRVLGGRVNYNDERTPDADELTKSCTEGDFDCIVGDRKKLSGTYREFVIFDTENVYPEYIIEYQRGEMFKSPSHP